ncbi:MAG: GEVED domain-containing protein [Saprospiraceae bacterium]|nr:GEVED domain-containing protein [Saprospiraceae bacterium]
MKRFLTFLVILFPLLLSSQAYKYMMEDPSYNVYDVVEEAEKYFSTIDRFAKGSGWMGYQRWLHKTEPNFYPTGDRSQTDPRFVQKAYDNFVKRYPQKELRNNEDTWEDLGPYTANDISGHYSPGLGRVEEVWVDSTNTNTMYLASRSGGFWRSFDGGDNWENTTDFLPASGVDRMSVNPSNVNDILINVRHAGNGVTMGIYRSLDGGATWNTTAFHPDLIGLGGLGTNDRVFDVEFSPYNSNHIFIAATGKLFRSTDNLATIQEVSNNGYLMVEFHPTDPNIIYAPREYYWSRNQIYRSTDAGASWTLLHDLPENNYNQFIAATSPAEPNTVFFSSNAYIWKSTDNGVTVDTIPGSAGWGSDFEVSDTDPDIMINGKINIFMSYDGGQNWSTVTQWYLPNATTTNYVHADLRYALSLQGTLYCGTDGYMVKSEDNGVTWEILSDGTGVRENYRFGNAQSNIDRSVCGSQDNGTSIYRGKDNEWLEWIGADGMEGLIHPLDYNRMIGSIQYGNKRRSTDGGYTTSSINNHPSIGDLNWVAPIFYDPMDHFSLFTVGKTVHQSSDFGSSWNPLFEFSHQSMNHLVKSENDSEIIMAAKGSILYRSTDKGITFTQVGSGVLPNYSIQDISFDPTNDDNVIVVYSQHQDNNNRIFKSEDGGVTWQNISFNLSAMPVRSVVIDHTGDKNIYIGAEAGIYKMPWSGSNYELWSTDLPTVSVYELEIVFGANLVRAVTWGRGMWERCIPQREDYPVIKTVEIDSEISDSHPQTEQNISVTSTIENPDDISSIFIQYSINSIGLDQTLPMKRFNKTDFVSDGFLPQGMVDDKIYFKIFAVNSLNDTTETYRYMYTLREPDDYCDAEGDDGTGSDYINAVELADIKNSSGQDGYGDFTDVTFELDMFKTYPIKVTLQYHWEPDTVYAWIDWDKSKSFDDDEIIFFSMLDANHIADSEIVVPGGLTVGDSLRMRVRSQYWNSAPNPCGTATGEVEDYTILINDGCASGNTITNLNDFGNGSLRYLIEQTCPNDTVFVNTNFIGDTLFVYNEEIEILDNIVIVGLENNSFTISGNNERRIFNNPLATNLALKDLKLVQGYNDPDGGALINFGHLILTDTEFEQNFQGVLNKAFTNYGEVIVKQGMTTIKD